MSGPPSAPPAVVHALMEDLHIASSLLTLLLISRLLLVVFPLFLPQLFLRCLLGGVWFGPAYSPLTPDRVGSSTIRHSWAGRAGWRVLYWHLPRADGACGVGRRLCPDRGRRCLLSIWLRQWRDGAVMGRGGGVGDGLCAGPSSGRRAVASSFPAACCTESFCEGRPGASGQRRHRSRHSPSLARGAVPAP